MAAKYQERILAALAAIARQPATAPIEEAERLLSEVEAEAARRIRDPEKRRVMQIQLAEVLFIQSIRRDCPLEVNRNYLQRLRDVGFLHISHRVGDHLLYAEYCVQKGCTTEAYQVLRELRDELTAMDLDEDTNRTELHRVDDLTERIRSNSLDPL
jgi:hypothetical protein